MIQISLAVTTRLALESQVALALTGRIEVNGFSLVARAAGNKDNISWTWPPAEHDQGPAMARGWAEGWPCSRSDYDQGLAMANVWL